MTTSGTAALDYEVGDIIFDAYERAGYDVQQLNADHMRTARRSLNLIMIGWSNRTMLPFAMDEQSFTVTEDTASYSLPTDTVDVIADVVLRRDGNDTPVTRISRQDYTDIPDKASTGRPDRFWVNRAATPVMYLWQVPENSTDTIRYWRIRRLEDITASAETADVSFRWIPALTSALAVALTEKLPSESFDQGRYSRLEMKAREDFIWAVAGNADRASMFIRPIARRV